MFSNIHVTMFRFFGRETVLQCLFVKCYVNTVHMQP